MEEINYTPEIINASDILGITKEEAALRFRNFNKSDWARYIFWYTTGLDVE